MHRLLPHFIKPCPVVAVALAPAVELPKPDALHPLPADLLSADLRPAVPPACAAPLLHQDPSLRVPRQPCPVQAGASGPGGDRPAAAATAAACVAAKGAGPAGAAVPALRPGRTGLRGVRDHRRTRDPLPGFAGPAPAAGVALIMNVQPWHCFLPPTSVSSPGDARAEPCPRTGKQPKPERLGECIRCFLSRLRRSGGVLRGSILVSARRPVRVDPRRTENFLCSI